MNTDRKSLTFTGGIRIYDLTSFWIFNNANLYGNGPYTPDRVPEITVEASALLGAADYVAKPSTYAGGRAMIGKFLRFIPRKETGLELHGEAN